LFAKNSSKHKPEKLNKLLSYFPPVLSLLNFGRWRWTSWLDVWAITIKSILQEGVYLSAFSHRILFCTSGA